MTHAAQTDEEPIPQAGDELKDTSAPSVPSIMGGDAMSELPAGIRAGLELTRQHTQVAAALASMSWGKGMTVVTRRAVAAWCERWGVDPITELDVLGGNFYLNSEYFLRRLGELRDAGRVVDFWLEHIHSDERLYHAAFNDANAPEDVKAEASRRWYQALFKRTEYNVPEAAAAACVCYIRLPNQEHVIAACKFGGGGTSVMQPRRGGQSAPNPIVEANPELSVESQSVRRAMRMVTSPISGGGIMDRIEGELAELSVEHAEEIQHAAAAQERATALAQPAEPPKALASGDGYDELPLRGPISRGEPTPVRVVERRSAPAQGLGDMGDVMGPA